IPVLRIPAWNWTSGHDGTACRRRWRRCRSGIGTCCCCGTRGRATRTSRSKPGWRWGRWAPPWPAPVVGSRTHIGRRRRRMSHVDEGALHAYLDGALDEYPVAEARRIRAHLECCGPCIGRLEEERSVRERASAVLSAADAPVVMPPLE